MTEAENRGQMNEDERLELPTLHPLFSLMLGSYSSGAATDPQNMIYMPQQVTLETYSVAV